jgi:hypothetical protein
MIENARRTTKHPGAVLAILICGRRLHLLLRAAARTQADTHYLISFSRTAC